MAVTASVLVRSKTAWSALASTLVVVFGPKIGLDSNEVALIVGSLQALIGSFYVADKRRARR